MYNYLILFIIVLVLLLVNTSRWFHIRFMFLLYNLISGFGIRWRLEPHICSGMTEGFEPVMPLEYYAEFNQAIYPRNVTGDNTIHSEKIKDICDRNLKWLQDNAAPQTVSHSVPIVMANDSNSKQKIKELVSKGVPFLIRGVTLDCQTNMKYSNLIKKAGKNKVYMSASNETSCPKNIFVPLQDVEKNRCYITNSTNLFYLYPDLFPQKDIDTIGNLIGNSMGNTSKQLFLGVDAGSGTPLHSAFTNNFFVMIEGSKKWTFFNPNQLALLYPYFQEKGVYTGSECRLRNFETDDMTKYPLIRYAPRYEVIVEEGDILYNPRSWFHAIHNITDVSVACSTRWSNSYSIPDYHMMRYGNMQNPHLREYVFDIYEKTGVLGIYQIDEHKHMIGEENADALPYWDVFTNDSNLLCTDKDCSKHWHNS